MTFSLLFTLTKKVCQLCRDNNYLFSDSPHPFDNSQSFGASYNGVFSPNFQLENIAWLNWGASYNRARLPTESLHYGTWQNILELPAHLIIVITLHHWTIYSITRRLGKLLLKSMWYDANSIGTKLLDGNTSHATIFHNNIYNSKV